MSEYINEAAWQDALGQADWSFLNHDFKRLEALARQHEHEPGHKEIKREAYAAVEQAVREGYIPLAAQGEDFDRERKPIDTVVIHHTKNEPGITLERLNAMHLLRIYAPHYTSPAVDPHSSHGQPLWSGHFYNGQQVFWGYHWLIRADGTAEQILDDRYIGWQAGNWDINIRSIGICVDDDLSSKAPSEVVVESIAAVIREHYTSVEADHIIGHRDANRRTVCPGELFHTEWRQQVIDTITKTVL